MSRLFGDVRQNGYVVRDIEAAMRHWVDVMGVGPWFYLERAPIDAFTYRGTPSDVEVSIALTNSGPLQIELIQQRNDAPSGYRDFLEAGHEGLQHVAYWTEDFDGQRARANGLGLVELQAGQVNGRDGRFVYFETGGHPGTVIEVSEVSGPKGRLFDRIREASASWDGSDAIRRIG
ncbi:MAG: VOC family protein [Myxococcota bacterium]